MSTKLFIGGLSFDTTTESLRGRFEEFGQVEDATIITDRETGRARGFGFVTFTSEEDATKAISEANQTDLDGRTIRVDHADNKSRGGSARGGFRGGRGGNGGFRGARRGGYGEDRGYERSNYDREGGDRRGGHGGGRGGYRPNRGGDRGGYGGSRDRPDY